MAKQSRASSRSIRRSSSPRRRKRKANRLGGLLVLAVLLLVGGANNLAKWWQQLGRNSQVGLVLMVLALCIGVVVLIGLAKAIRSLIRSLGTKAEVSSQGSIVLERSSKDEGTEKIEIAPQSSPSVEQPYEGLQPVNRFVEVPLGSADTTFTLGERILGRQDRAAEFVASAKIYKTYSNNSCPAVPCNSFSPVYLDFDDDQHNWYFFWRSQVRVGIYLPTDLAYIKLHAFEIASLIETEDPRQAATLLKRLWQEYRNSHRDLDYYLPHLGGDLLAFKVGAEAAFDWWFSLRELEAIPPEVMNAGVHYFVKNQMLDRIPAHIWYAIVLYDAGNHAFYKKEDYGSRIDAAVIQAIGIANDFWFEKNSKSLLDVRCPGKARPIKKQAFVSAVVPKDYPQQITLGEGREYHTHDGLRTHVSSLINSPYAASFAGCKERNWSKAD